MALLSVGRAAVRTASWWTYAILAALACLANVAIVVSTYPALGLPLPFATRVGVAMLSGLSLLIMPWTPRLALVATAAGFVVTGAVASFTFTATVLGYGTWHPSKRPLALTAVAGAVSGVSAALAPWLPGDARWLAPSMLATCFALGLIAGAMRSRLRAWRLSAETAAVHAVGRARDTERERMMSELHDGLGHRLTAINIQARLLTVGTGGSNEPARLAMLQELAARALDDMQDIVHPRTPASPHAPKSGVLRSTLHDVATGLDLDASISVDASVDLAPFPVTYALARICQEAMTNAARHAPGTAMSIIISNRDGVVHARLENARVHGEDVTPGRGLTNMRSRAQQLGGTLIMQTSPPPGVFLLSVSLPLSGYAGPR